MISLSRVMSALAAVSLTAPALAQSAQQFDLICTGQQQFRPDMKPTAVTHRYRIDLDAKRWCWEQCQFANDIQSVTADRITFYENLPGQPTKQAYIRRTDGKYFRYSFGRSYTHDEGTCQPAPFSGLPAPRF